MSTTSRIVEYPWSETTSTSVSSPSALPSSHASSRPNASSAARTAAFDAAPPTTASCCVSSGSDDHSSVTAGRRSGRICSVRMRTACSSRGALGAASAGHGPNRASSSGPRFRGRAISGVTETPPLCPPRGVRAHAFPSVPAPIAAYSIPDVPMPTAAYSIPCTDSMSASVGALSTRDSRCATPSNVGSISGNTNPAS